MPWYRQLHWQIIIGMVLGLIYGLVASRYGWIGFTDNWIKPWGTIFINLLKMIAMPMILASLVAGVASLSDLAKLSRIGGKTIALFLITTTIAVTIGLLLVNVLKPGKTLSPQIRKQLAEVYQDSVQEKADYARKKKEQGPLQPIVDIVPPNIIDAASNNRNMLQMVFLAVLIGVGLVKSDKEKTGIISKIFDSLNELILRVVELIMLIAPVGVFAQIASVITDLGGEDPIRALKILKALGFYMIVIFLGLIIHVGVVYMGMLKLFTDIGISRFLRAIRPAQLIGFSTSSSAATLPITMECCEKGLGLPEEITGFTLPVGATVNMDGTSLYQAVAVVFIAQIMGMDLSFANQITIVITCVLASVGAAGVPGAGIVMLVIVLQSINVPVAGIALIIGVDRLIDMFRTATNLTGDATVTAVISYWEDRDRIKPPEDEISERISTA